jgi:hypothetical protein
MTSGFIINQIVFSSCLIQKQDWYLLAQNSNSDQCGLSVLGSTDDMEVAVS